MAAPSGAAWGHPWSCPCGLCCQLTVPSVPSVRPQPSQPVPERPGFRGRGSATQTNVWRPPMRGRSPCRHLDGFRRPTALGTQQHRPQNVDRRGGRTQERGGAASPSSRGVCAGTAVCMATWQLVANASFPPDTNSTPRNLSLENTFQACELFVTATTGLARMPIAAARCTVGDGQDPPHRGQALRVHADDLRHKLEKHILNNAIYFF